MEPAFGFECLRKGRALILDALGKQRKQAAGRSVADCREWDGPAVLFMGNPNKFGDIKEGKRSILTWKSDLVVRALQLLSAI